MAKVKFTTNIDEDLLTEIKIVALKEKRNVNEIIEELLKGYLNKENKEMEKQLNILKNKEDKTLTLSYKGIDLEEYDYITIEEFIEEVENADTWDMIDSEIYEEALKEVGLNYDNYDDSDKMWDDFLNKIK